MLCGSGASELGFQLAMYRWLDGMEEARRIRDASVESQNTAIMVARHNELVGRFNKLATAATQLADYARTLERGTQDRDARIVELERQLADSSREQERLRILCLAENQARLKLVAAEEEREMAARSQPS